MLELEAYYEKSWRVWILVVLDADGNQMFEAEYYPNKQALQEALK